MIEERKKIEIAIENLKKGSTLQALRVEVNQFSISGSVGCEIHIELSDMEQGVYTLKLEQKGVPELRPIYFALINPAIVEQTGEIRMNDGNYLVVFKPILE